MSVGPQPCGCPRADCPAYTFKTQRNGHAVGCICGECSARGNQRSGARAEGRRHKRLSSGRAPVDESAYAYDIRVSTQDKTGKQIPTLLWHTLESAFFTKAFKQAHDKIPVGSNTFGAVYVEHEDGRAFLLVDVSGRSWK